jgi:hypothetical protein
VRSRDYARFVAENIEFWHSYPELLLQGLTPEQLAWQPEAHDTTIAFATWHAYRAADELIHAMVMGRPSVHTSQAWADRLPVDKVGATPFGNGGSRAQIAAIRLDPAELCAYAKAVGASIVSYLDDLSEDDAAALVQLPFFAGVYPGMEALSKVETIAFFAIGHTSEHLGEVQMLKGMMGLKGAPL